MVVKGYTTATLVAKELGRDLTAPQLDECADLISQAEDWIDNQTGRSWLVTSVSNELHTVTGPFLYLNTRPVAAISSLTVRPYTVAAAETVLGSGTGYELIDPQTGLVSLAPSWDVAVVGYGRSSYIGWLLKASYTATVPLPGDVQRGATLLVAHWMLPRLDPDRAGVDSYSIGGELMVKLRKDDIPDEVMRLINGREAIIFA
jgi:hypothetical protein